MRTSVDVHNHLVERDTAHELFNVRGRFRSAERLASVLDLPPDLAEDVVLGKICLAGGGALLLGLAARIETAAGIPALVVDDPLRCVVRGAADILDNGHPGGQG